MEQEYSENWGNQIFYRKTKINFKILFLVMIFWNLIYLLLHISFQLTAARSHRLYLDKGGMWKKKILNIFLLL